MEQPYKTVAIITLAQTCMILGEEERPELEWLKSRYEHIQDKYHLKNKGETDRFLYQKMYGCMPEKSSEVLKIRYWRTGKCTPGNREQCRLFGQALELSNAEMKYLIQGYYDRSLEAEPDAEQKNRLHKRRQQYIQKLVDNYLSRVSQEQLKKLNIRPGTEKHFFRHLYFTDAFHYIDSSPDIRRNIMQKHITSSRYDSELRRQMRLIGEIPRRTFIRHLLILEMPDITLEKMNEQLKFFGYLPLNEEHTMIQGERLDWLLIQLLTRYEDLLKTEDRQTCLLWFQKACRTLDLFFMREGLPRMRFMHFKALEI